MFTQGHLGSSWGQSRSGPGMQFMLSRTAGPPPPSIVRAPTATQAGAPHWYHPVFVATSEGSGLTTWHHAVGPCSLLLVGPWGWWFCWLGIVSDEGPNIFSSCLVRNHGTSYSPTNRTNATDNDHRLTPDKLSIIISTGLLLIHLIST